MPGKTIDQRISKADARLADLKARQRKQKRTNDTRLKILVGAFVLNKIQKSPESQTAKSLLSWLRRDVPKYYRQDRDRKLLDAVLNAKIEPGATPAAEQSENPAESGKNVDSSSGSIPDKEP